MTKQAMTANNKTVRRHLKLHGNVQGVFFRDSARKEAQRLGLGGYAKNLPDGSLEMEVEGGQDKVNQFIQWARSGPPQAEVEEIEANEKVPAGDGDNFVVI